jgi:hypothetical protein
MTILDVARHLDVGWDDRKCRVEMLPSRFLRASLARSASRSRWRDSASCFDVR